MTVSFVIPTRNRSALLELALRSILRQTGVADIDIFVVDNGSTDDTEERIKALRRETIVPITYIAMPFNGGPSCSRNHGARSCWGDLIAFIDSDVELEDGWLATAVAVFSNPRVGMISGKVVFASSPDTVYCFGGELSRIGFGWDARQAEESASLQQDARILWAPSASLMARREVFLQLGGFDETYFYGYEDSDLGWRFNLAGWECLCVAGSVSRHATTEQIDDCTFKVGDQVVFHYTKNRLRSLLKNYSSGSLVCWLPLYAVYSLVDSLLRAPRSAKIRALWWSLINLNATLAMRKSVQSTRRTSDAELSSLFHSNLFPPQPLKQRMEKMRALHGPRMPGSAAL